MLMEITEAEILEAGFVPKQKAVWKLGKGTTLVTVPGEFLLLEWRVVGKRDSPEVKMYRDRDNNPAVEAKIGGLFFKLVTGADFKAFIAQIIPKFCEPK
jgi:hypothetical protein